MAEWHQRLGATRREPTSLYRNSLRNYGIVRIYAARNGLDDACCNLAKHDYRTKPQPSSKERQRYATMALHGDAPWWKRYERAISILFGRPSNRR